MRERPVVAIDGPAGAGKSTVTRRVAERLGYVMVDTGALYRTVALAAQRRGIAWDDEQRVGELAFELAQSEQIQLSTGASGQTVVRLAGDDVSKAIRSEPVSQGASRVSAIPAVRDALLELQRKLGRDGGIVAEGRDIGTVVFPEAEAKFFLTASVGVRARRRFEELQTRGEQADLEQVQREVEERDRRDSNRPVAPLKRAGDAELIDSSTLSVDQVVERIVQRVREVEQRLHDAGTTGGGA